MFDLGKVLLDFDYGIALRRLLPLVQAPLADLHRLINQSPLLFEYETGRIATAEFYERVRAATQFQGTFELFRDVFGDIFTEIAPMVALHADLRARGCPTYVLSNTNELAIQHIRRRFPFFAHFDAYVLSFEHRAMKPDPALYAVLERLTGLHAGDLFYLDDRPENVAAGQARGWRGVVHHDPELTRRALLEAGLLNQ